MKKFAHAFIETETFERMAAVQMEMSSLIWKAMQEKKNFRMVLEYDAEARNVNIDFEESTPEPGKDFFDRFKAYWNSPEHQEFMARFDERLRSRTANRDTSSEVPRRSQTSAPLSDH